LALRQTEGLIGSVIRLLGLDLSVPDHTTLTQLGHQVLETCSGSGAYASARGC
jgi:methylase of polypeptide subunit release factors